MGRYVAGRPPLRGTDRALSKFLKIQISE